MSAPAEPTRAPALVTRPPVLRLDAEFLPAAIEILETPPSPNKSVFLLTICGFVTTALVWAYFGRIDIIASARGKIQPTGRVVMVQPVETGKVMRLHVRNGQAVQQGERLFELDDADARADEAVAEAAVFGHRAEALRRIAALAAVGRPEFMAAPIEWPADIPVAYQRRETSVLSGDLMQLAAVVASFDAQVRQKDAERRRLADTLKAQKTLIDVLQQRVDLRTSLVASGAGPITNLIDAKENLSFHASNYATTRGQLEESIASVDVMNSDRAKAVSAFVAENRQKLAEAERQVDEEKQRLAKARARSARLVFNSPIAGTIAAATVTAVGQVVSTGEEVMRIVPAGAALEIEAYLENKDAGFVKAGQTAEVKVESFPFTRYGTIPATVTHVSGDAIPDQDAQQAERDPARATRSTGFAGAQPTQSLVFPLTLEPQRSVMRVGDILVPLSPGMAVTVEVRTGSRRILEYVFSPLAEIAASAMNER